MHEQNLPSTPPIASPHGGGETRVQLTDTTEEIEPRILVCLASESAIRTALSQLLYPTHFFCTFSISIILTVTLVGSVPTHGAHAGYVLRDVSPLGIWVACSVILGFVAGVGVVFWELLFLRRFAVGVRQDGVCIYYPKRDVLLPWNKIIWIVRFNGDIWVASMWSSCLIPRECFASAEKSQKFAHSLRQLWDANGSIRETTLGQTNLKEREAE